MSRKDRRGAPKRSYRVWIIPALVLVTAVVGYYIFTASGTGGGGSPLNNTPVSSTDLGYLSGVSANTLSFVGSVGPGVNSPTTIANAPSLTLNGKPEVLYIGAEYCPFCAAERWAMIVALSRFGTFSGLATTRSAAKNGAGTAEPYPTTPTWTSSRSS